MYPKMIFNKYKGQKMTPEIFSMISSQKNSGNGYFVISEVQPSPDCKLI